MIYVIYQVGFTLIHTEAKIINFEITGTFGVIAEQQLCWSYVLVANVILTSIEVFRKAYM